MAERINLQAPFPWFGGKRRVADVVWKRFGDVPNYVEPFFGSGAVLLGRPHEPKTETINDLDGFVANFWRAVQRDPEAVAKAADNPPNELDLTARHVWLVSEGKARIARLAGDPDFYDAKVAGWWCWGLCCWIGSGWCTGQGPWVAVDGQLVHQGDGHGVNRQPVHLGGYGCGVNRKRVHLGGGHGVNRQLVRLGGGQGVNRKRVHLGAGRGGQCEVSRAALVAWMQALADRLRLVRVCCGDWERVCGPSPTEKLGLTGVFLDPPYSAEAGRNNNLYREESLGVAHRVREWCLKRGRSKQMRIALCGYEGEGHEALVDAGWSTYQWAASGGYSCQGSVVNINRKRERIWFSPACLPGEEAKTARLFDNINTESAISSTF